MKTLHGYLKQLKVDRSLTVTREKAVAFLFVFGLSVAFWTSLHPWFLWPLETTYFVFAAAFIILAMMMDKRCSNHLFTNKHFWIPLLSYTLLLFFQKAKNDSNVTAYIESVFECFVFFALFRYKTTKLAYIATLISKMLGAFLCVSLTCYLLYLNGFGFPGYDLTYGDDFYSFTNHYVFMIDDRGLAAIFPRFLSIFLEPSHLGTVIAVLLLTQRGKWKKWYNVANIIALALTFSLGAYMYFVAIIFLNLWVKGKKFLSKLLATITVIAGFVAGSFVYNGGDNLVHDLILARLEIDDGELAGNNRTTVDFDQEFSSFLNSNDIWFGRELADDLGNSGYKVFFYRNGIFGLALFFVFILSALWTPNNKKASFSSIFVALMIFGVDGFVTWMCRFFPLYANAKTIDLIDSKEESNNDLKQSDHEPTT